MTRVAIGIHVDDEPARAAETLASVRTHDAAASERLLLLDGLTLGPGVRPPAGVTVLASARQLGRAAWFNRLHRATSADVVVLLESGTIVGPGWLDALLHTLATNPRHGLAGPSTNRAWNEQCAFAGVPRTPLAIASAAATAAITPDAARTLAPLYSLGDFCYAVKRDVIDAIGDADERYDVGPCWEMDYNARAERAGWRGVWATRAFVWRAPATPRRVRDEQSRFEHSKRLYQDTFCALRLRGDRATYETHCRGEDCEHFAPRGLVQLVRRERAAPAVQPSLPPASTSRPARGAGRAPLVSCIMPTRDRPEFALQAVRLFLRQDYAARELVILDDGEAGLQQQLPSDPRIRYERLAPGLSIGAKRNHGGQLARGEILLHWDDDDWYAPTRISAQIAPLVAGEADVCGLIAGAFLVLDRWEFWRCSADLHRRLFVHDVHGGTLAIHRRVWDGGARYPDLSLAEDAVFLRDAVRRGARLARVPGDGLFVYVRHAASSWRFVCGQHIDPAGWTTVPEPALLGDDRQFYAERSPRAPAASPAETRDAMRRGTLVSCIMPTANRRLLVPRAVEYFLRQEHERRELIVIDDGADPVAELIPADTRIRYLRLPARQTIGAKRNIACEEARGDLIVHWDDDDWASPARLSRQVAALVDNPGADMCGLASLLFYEPATRRAWRYTYRGGRTWVSGNTLGYRRSAWRRRAFLAVDDGEDTRFVWSAPPGSVLVMDDPSFFVGIMHGANASAKRTAEASWQLLEPSPMPELLGDDLRFYDALAGGNPGVDATAAARMAPVPVPRVAGAGGHAPVVSMAAVPRGARPPSPRRN